MSLRIIPFLTFHKVQYSKSILIIHWHYWSIKSWEQCLNDFYKILELHDRQNNNERIFVELKDSITTPSYHIY